MWAFRENGQDGKAQGRVGLRGEKFGVLVDVVAENRDYVGDLYCIPTARARNMSVWLIALNHAGTYWANGI